MLQQAFLLVPLSGNGRFLAWTLESVFHRRTDDPPDTAELLVFLVSDSRILGGGKLAVQPF